MAFSAASPVGPLGSADLVGVAAGAEFALAERLMREHAVRRLPVIDNGQVVSPGQKKQEES